MITDRRIEEARQAGEKNKQTIELVHNWRAHIRVHAEGVGMLAQMTGLPIGHHSLSCEHASGGGMAAWDMARVALHFYDENCANCTMRKAVTIPNLKQLVDAREERRRKRHLESERAEKDKRDKFNARQRLRDVMRPNFDPVAVTTVDLISELDASRTKDAADKLVGVATLAPESFEQAVIDHLFWLLLDSGESGLQEPVLRALAKLPIDSARLCDAALRSFYGARHVAAEIIEKHAILASEDTIGPAIPGLITLASPGRQPISGPPPAPVPGPLLAVHRAHPASVRAALAQLLNRTDAYSAQLAARGVRFLTKEDTSLLEFGTDELMGKVARARWLVEGRDRDVDEALFDIRRTLVEAFQANPARVDKSLNDYLCGASEKGRSELFKVYQDVLRLVRRSDEKTILTDAHRIAFRRLVTEATRDERDRADISSSLFHGEPYELTPLALEELDLLLGSAALVATRLDEVNSAPLDPKNPLADLNRIGTRSRLDGLLRGFVRWACAAAGQAGSEAIDKVLATLRGLPEKNERLRATIVGAFPKLITTVDGLQRVLPEYYAALVGSSQLVRSKAATAFGEMPRVAQQNLPSLAFEAFCALMLDPYVIVHRAAIRALERFSLPDGCRAAAMSALSQWILYYSQNRSSDGDRFLVEALELYAYRYASDEQLKDGLGDRLLEILSLVSPELVMQESRRGVPVLARNRRYVRFFLLLLADDATMQTYHDELLEILCQIPAANLYEVRDELREVGSKVAAQYPWAAARFAEALTACGAWKEAAEMMEAVVDAIPTSAQYLGRKLHLT